MQSTDQQFGFTLIEVLIALAIMAIALTALVKASSFDVKDANYLKQKNISAWVASNINTQLQTGFLAASSQQGTENLFRQNWPWQVKRSKTADTSVDKLTIIVRATPQGPPLTTLESFILLKKAHV